MRELEATTHDIYVVDVQVVALDARMVGLVIFITYVADIQNFHVGLSCMDIAI